MNTGLIEIESRVVIPEGTFCFGERSLPPILFPNNTIALMSLGERNDNLAITLISNGKPAETFWPDLDIPSTQVLPIFRVFASTDKRCELVGFFPGNMIVYWIDIVGQEVEKEFDDMSFVFGENRFDAQRSDWDYYFEPSSNCHYILRTTTKTDSGDEEYLHTTIDRISPASTSGKTPTRTCLASSISADRPLVFQGRDLLIFGIQKNTELEVVIDQAKRPLLRLAFRNVGVVDDMRIEKMFNSIGCFQLGASRYLALFFNNNLIQSGLLVQDLSTVALPPNPATVVQVDERQAGSRSLREAASSCCSTATRASKARRRASSKKPTQSCPSGTWCRPASSTSSRPGGSCRCSTAPCLATATRSRCRTAACDSSSTSWSPTTTPTET